jgi:hypothetical protein
VLGLDDRMEPAYTIQFEKIPLYSNAPRQGDPVFTFALDLQQSGRITLRYKTVPQQMVASLPSSASHARSFIRSRQGLVRPSSALEMEFADATSGTTISLCPVPKTVCISPACGAVGGGTVVTIIGTFFDHSCLNIGKSYLHKLYCHFGAMATPATVISDTELRCMAPAAEAEGRALFQLSYGRGTPDDTEYLDLNGAIDSGGGASTVDTTFLYTASSSVCGCSTSAPSLACDVCGTCGGGGECFGCDGLFLSDERDDACGLCGGDNSTCTGCDGVLFSGTQLDQCGVCDGGDITRDCHGDCFGSAVVDDCGTCAGGQTGLVVNSEQDCKGVCNGPSTLDKCDTCDADPSTDCTRDCADIWGGSAAVDSCGVCSGGVTEIIPDSKLDCAGVCDGLAGVDDCGVCSGGTTSHAADSDKDSCGECSLVVGQNADGTNAYDHAPGSDKDCEGACFGGKVVDACGICGGEDGTLACDGTCDVGQGVILPNQCGQCEPFGILVCEQDCHGDWALPGAAAFVDGCGECVGGGTGKADGGDRDCAGQCFGSAAVDGCAICSGGSTGVLPNQVMDCAGYCNGAAYTDHCDICNGNPEDDCLQDCADVWGGTASFDSCNICTQGTTGVETESARDCNNDCFGGAKIDACGMCSGGGSGTEPNAKMDCTGECFGSFLLDKCGHCVHQSRACKQDCSGVWAGTASPDDCGECSYGTSEHEPNSDKDCTGVCHGFAFKDNCGLCSGPGTSHSPNSDRDACGVCSHKGSGHVKNSDMDCAGICRGSARTDECGVCTGGVTTKEYNEDMGCDSVCFSGARDCQMLYWGPVIIITSGGLIGLTVITALIVLRRRLYRRRRREPADEAFELGPGGGARAAQNVEDRERRRQAHLGRTARILERLPPFVYDPNDETGFSNDACSICLGEFEAGEEVRRLPCHHTFHGDCVATWLQVSRGRWSHFHGPPCSFCMENHEWNTQRRVEMASPPAAAAGQAHLPAVRPARQPGVHRCGPRRTRGLYRHSALPFPLPVNENGVMANDSAPPPLSVGRRPAAAAPGRGHPGARGRAPAWEPPGSARARGAGAASCGR